MPTIAVLSHSGAELDAAITKVETDYADVSGVTATAADVLTGKKFVGADKVLTEGACDYADVSGVTAVAGDVASGKYFVDSSGVLTEGTASGGGGGSVNDIGVIEFLFQTTSSVTVHTTYDAELANECCADEDGNTFNGTNGVFQYSPYNGGGTPSWTSMTGATTSLSSGIYRFRFLNTDTNKPFIFKGTVSEWTGNDVRTEMWITGASACRYGPFTYGLVDTSGHTPSYDIWNSYNSTIGLAYQFDWVISIEID